VTDSELDRRAKIELRVEELFRSRLRKEYPGMSTRIALVGYEDALSLAKEIAVEVAKKAT
jgi:hypothetical protein